MTSDAHHFVAPHLPTVSRCIAQSIESAGIRPTQIDAVNAHAASTRAGDLVEFQALWENFGPDLPPVTANKSLIGHAMGASSAIETVMALEGLAHDVLPPPLNHTPDPQIPIDCVPKGARQVEQRYVLKNSFGFGGCNACIVLRKAL